MALRVTFLVAVAAFAAACGADDHRRHLVVYSAHGPDILKEFEARFEKTYPDVDVVTLYAGAQDILDRLRAERAAPQADVVWGADATTLDVAAQEGLLAPFEPTYATAGLPHHPAWLWTGFSHLPMVIGHHPDRAGDLPKTFADLASPQFRGQLILREPGGSGTMRTLVGSLVLRTVAAGGTEDAAFALLRSIRANVRSFEAKPELMFEALDARPGSLTIWNLTDLVFQAQAHGYHFRAAALDEPVPVALDGTALVRHGATPNADAVAFHEFVNSIDALRLLATTHMRIPVRPDFKREWLHPAIQAVAWKPLEVDREQLRLRGAAWMQRFEREVRPEVATPK